MARSKPQTVPTAGPQHVTYASLPRFAPERLLPERVLYLNAQTRKLYGCDVMDVLDQENGLLHLDVLTHDGSHVHVTAAYSEFPPAPGKWSFRAPLMEPEPPLLATDDDAG